ncbi:MAG: hypothetical protein Q7S12_00165 [bacterium]|nr:hypothetical protein [bacterium]
MQLSWGAKKQIKFFTIFALAILAIVAGIIYFVRPEQTCFDKHQNQDEEGVDCGGATCIPCSNQIRDINILWTRPFKITDGAYDFAALVENTNSFLKAAKLDYFVKFYDSENILIAIKENSTFAGAGEKFVIFEPSIITQHRIPVRAILEIAKVAWDKGGKIPLKLDVLSTNKFLSASSTPSRVEAVIKNQLNAEYSNIEATAILWDAGDTALGVSRTFVDRFDIDEIKTLTFTWPAGINGVSRVEVFFRQMP